MCRLNAVFSCFHPYMQELKEMRRAGVRTFAEAENYEADRKRRALEEGGARGDRAHARHRGRADEDDPAILAQVLLFFSVDPPSALLT